MTTSTVLGWSIWDSRSGSVSVNIPCQTPMFGLAFHPGGRSLATADSKAIQIWDTETGNRIRSIASKYPLRKVAYSPDGRWITAAPRFSAADYYPKELGIFVNGPTAKDPPYGDLTIWDAESGAECRALTGHYNGVEAVTFADEGRSLVSLGRDLTIKVWDVPSGRVTQSLEIDPALGSMPLAVDPGTRSVAFIGKDSRVHLRVLGASSDWFSFEPHAVAWSLAFTPDGRRLAVAGQSSKVKLWDLAAGQEILTLDGQAQCIHALAFAPDGRALATSQSDGTIKVWPGGQPTPP